MGYLDSGHALKSDGSLWTWGYNAYGALGNNSVTNESSPILVVGNHKFVEVVSTDYARFARKADGSVWSWGACWLGLLGHGDINSVSSPVLVVGNHSFKKISNSIDVFLALKSDGSAWTCGSNFSGGLGDGTTTDRSSPVLVVGNHSFIDLQGGLYFSCGLKADGSVWSWGLGSWGVLGNNTTTDTSSPVLVVGGHSFIQITVAAKVVAGLKSDGSVWTWGDGTNGSLGNNATWSNRSSPILVVGNHSFRKLFPAGGNCSLFAEKENHELWGWGINWFGELGLNDTDHRSSPVLVLCNHTFLDIFTRWEGGYGLKPDGSVWSWGRNKDIYNGTPCGAIGDNTTLDRSSPVLVVGNHNFTSLGFKIPISGSVCWGHVTGVEETNTRPFADNWTGDGEILDSGDAEQIGLNVDNEMVSEIVDTGVVTVTLSMDKYRTGSSSGPIKKLYYRTGISPIILETVGWAEYSVPFASSGYVQVRIYAQNP